MKFLVTTLSLLAVATSLAQAQLQGKDSSSFTDPATGIDFQAWEHPENKFRFGLALPKSGNDGELIGYLAAGRDLGWCGGDLGSTMFNRLLFVAWPSGWNVVGSIRLAKFYGSPAEYSKDGIEMKPIAKGSFVNGNRWQYIFLCTNCTTNANVSFPVNTEKVRMAMAMSGFSPMPATSSSAQLVFHTKGYANFDMNIAGAKSGKFAKWRNMAA